MRWMPEVEAVVVLTLELEVEQAASPKKFRCMDFLQESPGAANVDVPGGRGAEIRTGVTLVVGEASDAAVVGCVTLSKTGVVQLHLVQVAELYQAKFDRKYW